MVGFCGRDHKAALIIRNENPISFCFNIHNYRYLADGDTKQAYILSEKVRNRIYRESA